MMKRIDDSPGLISVPFLFYPLTATDILVQREEVFVNILSIVARNECPPHFPPMPTVLVVSEEMRMDGHPPNDMQWRVVEPYERQFS